MTENEWLAKVAEKQDALKSLLRTYHPRCPLETFQKNPLPITAPNVERVCHQIRQQIREENQDLLPVPTFEKALENKDTGAIINLLNEAWFGVPESTQCWGVVGFSEAVDLLEDVPDEEGETTNGDVHQDDDESGDGA